MALKFEIIGNNLVVTDTGDSSVKLERPVGDVYGVCEEEKFKILARNQRSDELLKGSYSSLIDASGATLNKLTLSSFFRTNLGFNTAGPSAITTKTINNTDLVQQLNFDTNSIDHFGALILALFKTVYLHQFNGVDSSGTTDCAAAINTAFQWARNNNYSVICRDSDLFLIGSQVIIDIPLRLDMGLARFVTSTAFNAVASPTEAIWVRGAYPYNQGRHHIAINIDGPYGSDSISTPPSNAATNLDGVRFGHKDMVSGQLNALDVDIKVAGFRRNIIIGTHNVWSLTFRGWSRKWLLDGIYFDCKVMSGESIVLDGLIQDNSYNAAGTATALVSPSNSDDGTSTNQALDVIVKDGSIDYTDKVLRIGSGTFNFYGSFWENNSPGSYGKLTYTAGRSRPIVNLFGGVIKKGMDAATTYAGKCPANGRTEFFETDGAVMLNIDGMQMPARASASGENTTGTQIVKVTGSPLQLKVKVPYDDAWTDPVVFPSDYLNQIANSNFTTNLDGWAVNGSAIARDAADGALAATGCVSFSTSVTEQTIKQRLVAHAGDTVFFNAWIKVATLVTGSANMMLKYYGPDGTTQVGTNQILVTVSAAGATWAKRGRANRPPTGAAFVDFILQTSANFDGVAKFDDIQACVM